MYVDGYAVKLPTHLRLFSKCSVTLFDQCYVSNL
jgi:hypothetical protein